MISKTYTSPSFVINLWTLLIRPLFDYSILHSKLYSQNKTKLFISKENQSLKKVLSLRKTTSNKIISEIMGYNPDKFAQELLDKSKYKWNQRLKYEEAQSLEKSYRIKTNPILISWHLIKSFNILFHKCEDHNQLISPFHLKYCHNIEKIPNISDLLFKGWIINNNIKMNQARKSRIKKKLNKFFVEQKNFYEQLIKIFSTKPTPDNLTY